MGDFLLGILAIESMSYKVRPEFFTSSKNPLDDPKPEKNCCMNRVAMMRRSFFDLPRISQLDGQNKSIG